MVIHWDIVEEIREERLEAGHETCRRCQNTDQRRWCMDCDHTGYEEHPPEEEDSPFPEA